MSCKIYTNNVTNNNVSNNIFNSTNTKEGETNNNIIIGYVESLFCNYPVYLGYKKNCFNMTMTDPILSVPLEALNDEYHFITQKQIAKFIKIAKEIETKNKIK